MAKIAHRLPPHLDRVVISYNPIAGMWSAQQRVDALVDLLAQQGCIVTIHTNLDEVTAEAIRWYEAGRLRALVGVGGDGTVAELLNRTPPGLPLTMLPTGNENLFARHVGLNYSPRALCRTILGGRLLRLDAGRAGARLFSLMLGCGFDAEVCHLVHQRRKGHCRSLYYTMPIINTVLNYRYPEISVEILEPTSPASLQNSRSTTASWAFVFNLPCYGGGLRIRPQANGRDGLLDVITFQKGGFWPSLRYLLAVCMQSHQRLNDVMVHRCRRLRISSPQEVRYQLDGDPAGVLPVEVEVLPERITVVVP